MEVALKNSGYPYIQGPSQIHVWLCLQYIIVLGTGQFNGGLARSNALERWRHQEVTLENGWGIGDYSLRRLFTGLADAARTAWELTVISAIKTASNPARANIHQLTATR